MRAPSAMDAYRALLWLFPSSFRVEYGPEMCADFAARRQRAQGALAGLALWSATLLDLLQNALRVHADVLRQDLRFTARTLGRSPGFTATAVLLAALGVAATTATFSVADYALVRPLPFRDPERLVRLWQGSTQEPRSRNEVSPANYRDWKRLNRSFTALAAYYNESVNLVGEGEPQRIEAAAFTADLLSLLGRGPSMGRAFLPGEDRHGAPGRVLISHRLWQTSFAGDLGILGRKVLLDDEPFEVIGVMPADFRFPTNKVELWTPARFDKEDLEERANTYIYVLGRLRPGVSLERARAEMKGISAQLERAYPDNAEVIGAVDGLRDGLSQKSRLLLAALCGAALCMLLIACTNLASLLITRAIARRRELAVRTALGGGRERLLRQLLTESLVLATAGGVLGIAGAVAALPLLSRLVPTSLPFPDTASLNLRVLAFAALVIATTGIAFGVAPAARACMKVDAGDLRGARGGIGDRRDRLRAALVVAEVTASVVLLVCSGLLVRALSRLHDVDPGFAAEGVLALRTELPLPRYEATARRVQFYRHVLDDVRDLPGVSHAAYITGLPMLRTGGIWKIGVPGLPHDNDHASLRYVSPGYFATLGIPVRQGRDVSEADTGEAMPVAVVSESFAQLCWPGQDPIGRGFEFANQDRTVVGVVGDVRVRGIERQSEPQVYLSYQQVPDGNIIGYTPKDLVIRSTVPTAKLLPAVRAIIARADPRQPISDVQSLGDIVAGETAPRALQVRVLGLFTLLAFLLAGIGLHGLLAFTVSARAPEIGVRIALGADTREILGLVLLRGATLAAAGVLLGGVLAYAAARSLEALLAGVSPHDPLTFGTAIALSAAMALAGSLLPALRAVRLDPQIVIRAE